MIYWHIKHLIMSKNHFCRTHNELSIKETPAIPYLHFSSNRVSSACLASQCVRRFCTRVAREHEELCRLPAFTHLRLNNATLVTMVSQENEKENTEEKKKTKKQGNEKEEEKKKNKKDTIVAQPIDIVSINRLIVSSLDFLCLKRSIFSNFLCSFCSRFIYFNTFVQKYDQHMLKITSTVNNLNYLLTITQLPPPPTHTVR